MARWNAVLGYTLLVLTVLMLSGKSVFAESSGKQIYQVAQNVPDLDTLDSGSGTLGEEEKSVIQTSEEGKKRFEKGKSIKKKKVLSTTGELGDDAKTVVPYAKFFSAGYVGEEMDSVGAVLGNRAARSFAGIVSCDSMTTTDIDIGHEDDVKVGGSLHCLFTVSRSSSSSADVLHYF